MDPYLRAFVKLHVHIDAGGRAFCKGEQLEVINSAGIKKVQLPGSKILYSFDDLKRIGAKVEVQTLQTLALAGAEGRWRDAIEERKTRGIPSNVYIANARTINKALAEGRDPPAPRWIGRRWDKMTEVYDTVDEVVDAMSKGEWRTEFSRGGKAKRRA